MDGLIRDPTMDSIRGPIITLSKIPITGLITDHLPGITKGLLNKAPIKHPITGLTIIDHSSYHITVPIRGPITDLITGPSVVLNRVLITVPT